MDSLSETGSCKHNEPEVGILVDLGSPFNQGVPANDNCIDTSRAETGSADVEDEKPERSSKDGSNGDAQSSEESAEWEDLADERLIDGEKFDFDLPVSPVESTGKVVEEEDEDEVFFGPVGFTESCIAKKTQLNSQSPEEHKPLSPLNVEQYLELFLEANKVALELAKGSENIDLEGSEDGDCKAKKETEKTDETCRSQKSQGAREMQSKVEKAVDEDRALHCDAETSDGIAKLPAKPEDRNFKRLVRKEMRSPRRGTYTISVSPANTPPPPHLPSADECVSKLARDKPKTMEFTAARNEEKQSQKAPQKESKLPVKGLRRSKLPMKGGLKKMIPPPKQSSGTSTDKLLEKKISSPPKRKRLNSCESEDMFSETSSVTSETLNTSGLASGIPKGKRPQPGSFHAKGASGLQPSGSRSTPTISGSAKEKSTNSAVKAKAPVTNGTKAPVTKPSLLQQGPLQRRTVQASRQLKLVKPSQRGSLQLTGKPQPLKAVTGIPKFPSTGEDAASTTPKKGAVAVSGRQTPSRKPSTPSTPIHLDKKAVPKRLLTGDQSASKPAARSLSASSVATPQSKIIPPSTPSRSESKPAEASAGSIRRRSGIPTPSRRSILSSSSRLNSTSSSISNPSPMQFRSQRFSTTTSSPSASPKPAPPPIKEEAIKLDVDSSPVCDKDTKASSGRPALETRTNKLEVEKSSPAVGLLIDLNQDTPDEKLSKASVTQGNTRNNKENLIDLL